MVTVITDNIDIPLPLEEAKLKTCINDMRDTLNEICCELDETDLGMKRLNVSCQLDELIVEYMTLKK